MDSQSPIEQNPTGGTPQKIPRKRKRTVISCTECHRRKQKCDRESPCSNCITRHKQSLCTYDNEVARKRQLQEESNDHADNNSSPVYSRKAGDSDPNIALGAFGYTKTNGHNNTTLGIFNKIQNYDKGSSTIGSDSAAFSVDHGGLREKYKSLIRQLPSKEFIEKLVVTYFREINYQYYPLDEGIFRDQLKDWNGLSFSTLNKGPLELHGDMQFFPALLFQMLALALQYQPMNYDPSLDSLKYAASMSLDDLAQDYSDSGASIVCLLPKRQTTLVTVQAGFLRTQLQKTCGMIPESWHSLSQTIKDAQEIGIHKDAFIDRGGSGDTGDIVEGLWKEQLRRRMWVILSLWDIHMAIVLGRPTTIDPRDGQPIFPIDAPIPKNRREVAPRIRTESDPPTPLSMLLWYAEISAPLWDIFNLEREDPHQNNIEKVARMHNLISQISQHCPPYFRTHNPDTSFDSHPDCYWLPSSRPLFQNNAAFTVMALHRPYIFTNATSRTEALKAGLDILRGQRTHFNYLSQIHYKMFSLVLSTFDAIILIAACYILHPHENREDKDDFMQHFQWAMERFHTMSSRNNMANGALGILKAIHVRLNKSLNQPPGQPRSHKSEQTLSPLPAAHRVVYDNTSSNSESRQLPTPHASISSASSTNTHPTPTSIAPQYTLPTISNLTSTSTSAPSQPPPAEWNAAAELDSFASSLPPTNMADSSGVNNPYLHITNMPPLQPFRDLIFNDLNTISTPNAGNIPQIDPALGMNNGAGGMGNWVGTAGGGMDALGGWQFEGAFGDGSFWDIMNNYNLG